MYKLITVALFYCALTACSSSYGEPEYEVQSQQFYGKTTEQGQKIFAYVITVKASRREMLDPDEPITRREFERYAEKEYFEESRVLKLQLEDQGAAALKKELDERQYCPGDYEITQVLWRDLSVQLRGECL
tara:strand:- start:9472 stop:9864 length:393 start_codon:yes stop_codon:yes gene_type:complete